MKTYSLIAIMGESGSGKDTLVKEVLKRRKSNKIYNKPVAYTTREPRDKEKDGVDYHFIDLDTFGEKMLRGELLEASCFNDWFYGTPQESLSKEKVNIGIFSPIGVDALIDNGDIDIVVFYIAVSDKTRLLRQLNREKNPDVNEIIRRFISDKEDFLDFDFHYNELLNENKKDMKYNVKVIDSAARQLLARKEQSS